MATLTKVFPCFFLSCKANARVKPAKTKHGPQSSKFLCYVYFCVVIYILCFVSFSVLFVCICILYVRHRVVTQLQINISYQIYVHCILGAAQQNCCPDGECYDLGPPWQSLTRLAPPPRCIEDPVHYLLSSRYKYS
jgi:hypothetical protein